MTDGTAVTPRVCLVVGQLAMGGLERQVYLLAASLQREGYDVLVVSLTGAGFWSGPLRKAGVRMVNLTRRGGWDWRRLVSLTRLFRRERPDVVYSFNYENNAYARLAGMLASVPLLMTGERGVAMSRWQGFVERVLIRFTECVVCNAEATRRDRVDRIGIPASKVVVIPNAIETPRVAPEARRRARELLGAGESEIVVGTVARLAPVKNLRLLIEAASRCVAVQPRLRFCIVGDGPEAEALRAAIRARRLEGVFRMPGEIIPASDILSGFDIFALTSHAEGLPNTVMEAMMAGLPCLCTDVGGCRELVAHDVSGYLVAPGDSGALSERILALAADPDRRAAMGRAGRRRIERDHAPEDLSRRTSAILQRLLSERSRRRRGHRLAATDEALEGGERHAPNSL